MLKAKVGVMLAQLAVYAKDEKEPQYLCRFKNIFEVIFEPDVTEYDVELP